MTLRRIIICTCFLFGFQKVYCQFKYLEITNRKVKLDSGAQFKVRLLSVFPFDPPKLTELTRFADHAIVTIEQPYAVGPDGTRYDVARMGRKDRSNFDRILKQGSLTGSKTERELLIKAEVADTNCCSIFHWRIDWLRELDSIPNLASQARLENDHAKNTISDRTIFLLDYVDRNFEMLQKSASGPSFKKIVFWLENFSNLEQDDYFNPPRSSRKKRN